MMTAQVGVAQTAIPWKGHNLKSEAGQLLYTGGTPTNNNTLYLFNKGAWTQNGGKDKWRPWLNQGGHWGIEGSCYEVGIPVYLYKTRDYSSSTECEILMNPNTSSQERNKLGWVRGGAGVSTNDEKGIYLDRKNEDVEKSAGVTTVSKWEIYPTGSNNEYWIARHEGTHWYYLCRPADDVEQRRHVLVAREGSAVEKSDNSKWIIVTKQDLINRFGAQQGSYMDMADATFYIEDQNFARNNGRENQWTKINGTGKVAFTNKWHLNSFDQEKDDYTIQTGDKAWTSISAGTKTYYNIPYGQFYCAEIKGGTGSFKQKITTVVKDGYYMLTCQGFYKPGDGSKNQNAYIYAKVPAFEKDIILPYSHKTQHLYYDAQDIKQKLPLISSKSKMPEDLTQAGMTFYEDMQNYSTKLIVYLHEGTEVEIGVAVDKETAQNSEDWTVVDNMQLKYLGTKYLLTEYCGNSDNLPINDPQYQTMVLVRDFVIDQWNSFILPQSLNKDQVVTAFGNDVKLARLKNLNTTGRDIEFESVDLNSMRWEDTAIEVNYPYLIMPRVAGPEKAIYWENIEQNEKCYTSHGPHYIFPAASFTKSLVKDFTKEQNPISRVNAQGKTINLFPTYYWIQNGTSSVTGGKVDASPNNYTYVMNKGKLTRYQKPFTLKGMRWYLKYSDAPSNAKLFIDGYDDAFETTTNIETVTAIDQSTEKKGTYTIDGRKVSEGNATEYLKKGIYIVDGKKVMVY